MNVTDQELKFLYKTGMNKLKRKIRSVEMNETRVLEQINKSNDSTLSWDELSWDFRNNCSTSDFGQEQELACEREL